MSGRIITLQRQVRELGRLRAGLTETTQKNGREVSYPTSSKTWILSSAHRDYLDAAAELWGGTVQEWEPLGGGPKVWRVITGASMIDALLPPGDPINQSYELWSRGGCQRRCDGETELRSGNPCMCLAQFGPDFHQQKQGTVCDIHTRLNVMLPDLPDIGLWRVESKGFWPANHITGYVDFIKAQAGPTAMVPVHLLIEPKRKVQDGKTSQYIEIVVKLRGAGTLGQMITGGVPTVALDAGPQRQAIEAGPAEGADGAADGEKLTAERVLALVPLTRSLAQVQQLWRDAATAKALSDEAKAALEARAAKFKQPEPAAEPAVEGEVEPDADTVWAAINAAAGERGWNAQDLEERVIAFCGKASPEANGWELAGFLDALKNGQVA